MSRSLAHLLKVVEELEEKGIKLESLRENINTTTATGRAFLSIMGAISQMERELRAERTAPPAGKRPELQQSKVLFDGGHTATEACQTVGVGKRTFFRYKATLDQN